MNLKLARLPLALLAALITCSAQVPITQSINVPNTGEVITPVAPLGARFTYLNPGLANYPNDVVEFAVSAAVTPDNKTLALITSGDYGIYTTAGAKDTSASTEWCLSLTSVTPCPFKSRPFRFPIPTRVSSSTLPAPHSRSPADVTTRCIFTP